jgi:hypothetical protein
MRHAIERIAARNYAEMESTFALNRQASPDNPDHPTLTDYERGQLFGRYERMLTTHNKLGRVLESSPMGLLHQGS